MRKILLDIGHPGHVHYFRNAISILEQRGNKVAVVARDKEVTLRLLDAYRIPYTSRGAGGRSLTAKLLYMPRADHTVMKVAQAFNPDLFLSFASPYAAHISRLMGKPHIAFDDTEHAKLGQFVYRPFTELVVTPQAYRQRFGKKQITFDSFIELCHLAPAYFKPDPSILAELHLTPEDRYILLRFVSWDANHDVGQKGLTRQQKLQLVDNLKPYGRIFISSEGTLPAELEPYRLKLPPEKLHHFLAYSSLYIGEGSTTASECALLGVPNILVNSLLAPATRPGVHVELERYGVQELLVSYQGLLDKAMALLQRETSAEWRKRRLRILDEKIDVTALMVWLLEGYPTSRDWLQKDPAYQYQFKIDTGVT
ncbi:DUF354 domain-containing protein [Microvirga pudoricolor]|uniref:DUF354 domain-containing protein n=1 Tax=Microvirga pudoricolor TaxID=2778729 RepID=UPI001952824F|nr:DUF354 domain-containing protein [Microvirga pudoricolor]MBM6593014.1 DUF354 domain-containing protein [Microvirga pudoricolor]